MNYFKSLDQVMEELEEKDRKHQARPLLVRKAVDVWWWARRTVKHPPRPWNHVRWAWQRTRRGYSDLDWWGFDVFLSEIIVDACKRFREEGHSHPADMTWSQWVSTLAKIESAFQAHIDLVEEFPDADETIELERDFKIGSVLFIEHFGSLWD